MEARRFLTSFFSWSTRIWSSEKILKIGRGQNFSLHAQGSPADRAPARDLSSMQAPLFGLRVAVCSTAMKVLYSTVANCAVGHVHKDRVG